MAIVMKKQADSQGEKGEVFEADVVGLDHEGRGIVRRSGKGCVRSQCASGSGLPAVLFR